MNVPRHALVLMAAGLVAAGLVLLAPACRNGTPKKEDGFLLKGSLLDGETGDVVSRQNFYVHFFCDEIDFQESLDPASDHTYQVRVPRPTVRIRAYDKTECYKLFEKTIEIEGDALDFDIPLTPTHYVRLFGKVIDKATGQPIGPSIDGRHATLLYFHDEGSWSRSLVGIEADGSFSIRVPRVKVHLAIVNTPLGIIDPVIELTGNTDPEYEYDIILK